MVGPAIPAVASFDENANKTDKQQIRTVSFRDRQNIVAPVGLKCESTGLSNGKVVASIPNLTEPYVARKPHEAKFTCSRHTRQRASPQFQTRMVSEGQTCRIFSAVRIASAWMVRAGASPPPDEGNTLASAIHRFCHLWLQPKLSTTELCGSLPIRQVPNTWVV